MTLPSSQRLRDVPGNPTLTAVRCFPHGVRRKMTYNVGDDGGASHEYGRLLQGEARWQQALRSWQPAVPHSQGRRPEEFTLYNRAMRPRTNGKSPTVIRACRWCSRRAIRFFTEDHINDRMRCARGGNCGDDGAASAAFAIVTAVRQSSALDDALPNVSRTLMIRLRARFMRRVRCTRITVTDTDGVPGDLAV